MGELTLLPDWRAFYCNGAQIGKSHMRYLDAFPGKLTANMSVQS